MGYGHTCEPSPPSSVPTPAHIHTTSDGPEGRRRGDRLFANLWALVSDSPGAQGPAGRRRGDQAQAVPIFRDSSRRSPTAGGACPTVRALSRPLQKMHLATLPFPLLLPPSTHNPPLHLTTTNRALTVSTAGCVVLPEASATARAEPPDRDLDIPVAWPGKKSPRSS